MNVRNGLIIKDLLQLKSYKKSLILSIILYIFIALSQSDINGISTMLIIMLTIGFGMYSIATFNYDEIAKSDKFILSLPITRKDIIISKYIFVIGSTLLGGILSILLSLIMILIFTRNIPNILDLLSLGSGAVFGIGLIESIQIPCIYKWGAEKGRLHMFILIMFVSLVLGGISFVSFDVTSVSSVISKMEKILPFVLVAAIVLMYFISYKISYRIYNKKEI